MVFFISWNTDYFRIVEQNGALNKIIYFGISIYGITSIHLIGRFEKILKVFGIHSFKKPIEKKNLARNAQKRIPTKMLTSKIFPKHERLFIQNIDAN